MWAGVSKSGSPALKLQISSPAARIALALASIASVTDGVTRITRVAQSILCLLHYFPYCGTLAGERRIKYRPFTLRLPVEDTPRGIRIPVASVKGRCPRPLDDGGKTQH